MIQMRNVSKQYGTKTVLKDVNLSVKRGESWVLFGADDAGKTTLLHLLMGYHISYEGKLALLGRKPNRLGKQEMEKVRYVPDDLILDEGLTGTQFLSCAERASSRYQREMEYQLSEHFQIPIERKLSEMSWQENKLIQMIAALAAKPELMILDEPMNFLEPDIWRQVLNCIWVYRQKGMTVLMTAVEYEDVQGQCGHYAYLKDGALLTGEVRENTGQAKKVTASRGNIRHSSLYRGNVARIQDVLLKAGYQDWTIEDLTLREELDMQYAAKK